MKTPDEIHDHECARMDKLMRAFDEAIVDGCGFGSHSIALVACVGFARTLGVIRRMYIDSPVSKEPYVRPWAQEQIERIECIIEKLDTEHTVREIVLSSGNNGTITQTLVASFVDHLQNRHWIELGEFNDPSVFAGEKNDL